MHELIETQKSSPNIINSDTEYVEELLSNILILESDSISKVSTFSEIGLRSKGKGVIIKFIDGKRYFVPIQLIPVKANCV